MWGRIKLVSALVLLLAATGCTISIQPWSRPTPPPQEPGPNGGPWQPPPPNIGGKGSMLPAHGANDLAAQLSAKLHEAELQKQTLVEQMQSVQNQMREKDTKLQQAQYAVDSSAQQTRRTREQLQQWQAELDELRDRVHRLEENRAKLKPVLDQILNHLDRPREPLRFPIQPN